MRATWLADVLRAAGLTVVEHTGWQTRGFQPWEPRYGIVHATAAPRTQSDADQVRIVRDGHSTLNGPIANCCVDRQGRWHVLASGRCNTALTGWAGPADGLGNTNLLGVEACNDNRTEPWPGKQYQAYAAGWAAICRRMGWTAARCVGHKEHQPGNKSDPTFSMTAFRTRVADYIEGVDDMSWEQRLELPQWVQDRWDEWSTGTATAEGLVTSGYGHARYTRDMVRDEVRPKLDAILAAVAGDDVAAAVAAQLAEHEQRMTTRLAGLPDLIAEAVAGTVPELTAEQIREPVAAALEQVLREGVGD